MTKTHKRGCGSCTLCCYTHGVSTSVRKLKNEQEWCKHCRVGVGCATYDARPIACLDFACAWLEDAEAGWERPDTRNFVPEWVSVSDLGRVLRLVAAAPDVLDTPYAIARAIQYANVYCPVLLCHIGKRGEACLHETFPLTDHARGMLFLWDFAIITPQILEERL